MTQATIDVCRRPKLSSMTSTPCDLALNGRESYNVQVSAGGTRQRREEAKDATAHATRSHDTRCRRDKRDVMTCRQRVGTVGGDRQDGREKCLTHSVGVAVGYPAAHGRVKIELVQPGA